MEISAFGLLPDQRCTPSCCAASGMTEALDEDISVAGLLAGRQPRPRGRSRFLSPGFTCVNDNTAIVRTTATLREGRMSKEQPRIVVAEQEDGWTLRFSGRSFDRFASQEEAVQRALEWARNAANQGQRVSVLLEGGDGQQTLLWPPDESAT